MSTCTCDFCGCINPVWFAPNAIWNVVMGGPPEAKDDPGGMLCPNCFIARAERAGIVPTGWKLAPETAADLEDQERISALTRELEEAKDDLLRRHKDAVDRWEALKPFADAANTLDMEGIEGFPFDDPREVLWAGEGGTITVADFRRAKAVVHDLSRAHSDSTETGAPGE